MEQPRVAPSAHHHGVSDEVIRHAFNNPIHSEQLDDALTMLIGPDHADGPLVVHPMVARPTYLR